MPSWLGLMCHPGGGDRRRSSQTHQERHVCRAQAKECGPDHFGRTVRGQARRDGDVQSHRQARPRHAHLRLFQEPRAGPDPHVLRLLRYGRSQDRRRLDALPRKSRSTRTRTSPISTLWNIHEDEVTWSIKLKVPADTEPGKKRFGARRATWSATKRIVVFPANGPFRSRVDGPSRQRARKSIGSGFQRTQQTGQIPVDQR